MSVITVEEASAIIQGSFPGADEDRSALFDKRDLATATVHRIGKHFILIFPNSLGHVAGVQWKAGGRWAWNVEAAKELDSYQPRTEADLIGWVSYVWDCVAELAQKTLISQLDPADLLPGGFKGPANSMMNDALEVLTQCGKGKHEVIRYVADPMHVAWVFNQTPATQGGTIQRPFSMLFRVSSSTEGHVVGRISEKFMGETPFQWAYKFPIGWETLERKGDLTFRGSDDDFIERAQKLLKRLYVKAIFDFLKTRVGKPKIDVHTPLKALP